MLKARYGDQWLFGKLLSGDEGLFPVNHVEIVVRACVCVCVSMQVLAVAFTCMCSDTLKVRYCEASS